MQAFEDARHLVLSELEDTARRDPVDVLRLSASLQTELNRIQAVAIHSAAPHTSWAVIGEALGITRQAAQQRYARSVQ
jgi:hypothetical protein